jgi:hypothetical protein
MGAFVSPLSGFLDAALTDFVKRFQNNALVSDIIAPRIPIPFQSGKYWIFGRENENLLQQTLRAPGAGSQRIRRTLSTGSFFASSHALSVAIPDEDKANYQAGDLNQDAAQDLMDKILLDKENDLATKLTDTAQVTNNATLAGTAQWSDYGNSDPESDVETALSKIREAGILPNFMVLGEPVYKKLKNHPAIKQRYAAIRPGSIGADQIAEVFGIQNVYIARAVVLDKAGASSFVWGKSAVIGYVNPGAGRGDVSGAKSFVWQGAPGTIGGFGTIVGRDPEPTAKADILGVDFYWDQVITAVETLYLIKNAVA